MIIMRLMGGLGNQMFQYALGRRLSIERKTVLKLDTSWFPTQTLRTFQLDPFNIRAEIAAQSEVDRFVRNKQRDLPSFLFRRYQRLLPYYRRSFVREQTSGFDHNILQARNNSLLQGYWQSENYFKSIRGTLLQDFTLRVNLPSQLKGVAEQIRSCNAVCLHVRRGDYANNPQVSQVHGVLSQDYYLQAAAQISKEETDARFFVFSDEPDWAENNLAFLPAAFFVRSPEPKRDFVDLHLMSLCRHFIIANSTFSWWAAWLSSYENRRVIAPKRWFNMSERDSVQIIPAGWQRI